MLNLALVYGVPGHQGEAAMLRAGLGWRTPDGEEKVRRDTYVHAVGLKMQALLRIPGG